MKVFNANVQIICISKIIPILCERWGQRANFVRYQSHMMGQRPNFVPCQINNYNFNKH